MSRLLALAIASAIILTACVRRRGAGPAPAGSGGTAGAEPGAFPVTIEHKFGETTVNEEPERIVVAGLREQDSLLALGIVPVATTEWLS